MAVTSKTDKKHPWGGKESGQSNGDGKKEEEGGDKGKKKE